MVEYKTKTENPEILSGSVISWGIRSGDNISDWRLMKGLWPDTLTQFLFLQMWPDLLSISSTSCCCDFSLFSFSLYFAPWIMNIDDSQWPNCSATHIYFMQRPRIINEHCVSMNFHCLVLHDHTLGRTPNFYISPDVSDEDNSGINWAPMVTIALVSILFQI